MIHMIRRAQKRKKRSSIWKLDTTQLKELVLKASTLTEILHHFNLSNRGGNFRTLKNRLKEDQIDFSHIKLGTGHNKGRKFLTVGLTKEEALQQVFTRGSKKSSHTVKRYLRKFSLIPEACVCGLTSTWCNRPLVLQLEHKDGDHTNQQLDNLAWLCPNCHSQTSTFAGRNNSTHKVKPGVANPRWRNLPKPETRKVTRPEKELLAKLVKTMTFTALGQKYGVSDNAVRKWCRSYQIAI